ncbi:MAG: methyltransferase domain-containing protein [Planctomycetota bacterium]
MIRKLDPSYLYLDLAADQRGTFADPKLSSCTERHRHRIELQSTENGRFDPFAVIASTAPDGVVLALAWGIPTRLHLRVARFALTRGLPVWFCWPREGCVEAVDDERLRSFRRHWWAAQVCKNARRMGRAVRNRVRRLGRRGGATSIAATAASPDLTEIEAALAATLEAASPVPFADAGNPGHGVYLRTDFWAPIDAGGSYGHTCYVAKWLAATSAGLTCFMPHRYSLLDELGLRQVVLESPFREWPEIHIVQATHAARRMLKAAFEALRPGYIFERLCLGNFAGARLSQELGIPYIVEYNGSEISMKRSFAGAGYEYEALYLRAEQAAFLQATLITVVSEPIKEDLVARGIAPEKILVNPNGADPEAYAPLADADRAVLRRQLGFAPEQQVIGFTGTFGGWHGIDVLADALAPVCERVPTARFLLIGDGNYRHLVDQAIERHRLEDRVRVTGRVAQQEGARLLQACDVFVSPHNAHMVDRRFFGSPTKIFEYMALARGIVATDLEQIGQVLAPALRAEEVAAPACAGTPAVITSERSLLCAPGDREAFVAGTCYLASHPDVSAALGRNARRAILEVFGWEQHVDRIWRAARGESVDTLTAECLTTYRGQGGVDAVAADAAIPERVLAGVVATGTRVANSSPLGGAHESTAVAAIATHDEYKDETQRQWNRDPCGSHYAREHSPETLGWYREVEEYRYGTYGPWMPEVMEFADHANEDVLEIGGGLGTDLAQFAAHGARVTDIDLSAGHLAHAQRNFALRGLTGRFVHHDAEDLPFAPASFDLVYSNGVIHHTPNTRRVVDEIFRVLRPGGRAVLMVYAENSLHYWRNLFYDLGFKAGELTEASMGEIMSRHVEISQGDQKPLVKVYTRARLRALLQRFEDVRIVQRQLLPSERPRGLRWLPADRLAPVLGWNLIAKARKPRGQ